MSMDLKENKIFIIPSFLGNLGFFEKNKKSG